MSTEKKSLYILGTRGIPAAHGGFETFCERLSLFLVEKGWEVTVFCQSNRDATTTWKGVKLVSLSDYQLGVLSSMYFDLRASVHASRAKGLFLTLGYNTAIFNLLQRGKGKSSLINMDGIEWRRDKWGLLATAWFWINERIGCWVGNHLIADHPVIGKHLATRAPEEKITMIPYGAEEIVSADMSVLRQYHLQAKQFSVIIARPEPENSILEMVSAFSRYPRGHKLLVLGNFDPETNRFHRRVMEVASSEVIFPGAIYDQEIVKALRFYARFYLHGHTVGGTNPSLVEAMGAGCAVIAHDNEFNRWVVGDGAVYFQDEDGCATLFDAMLEDSEQIAELGRASLRRFRERFTWDRVLQEYEELLDEWYPTD